MNSRAKNLIFWVVVGLFMILLFNLFSIPGQSPDEDIKFSDFISKVERGEISEVTIRGNNINGILKDGRSFKTYAVEYPDLVDTLRKSNVTIVAKPPEDNPWYITFLFQWAPFILFIGLWFFLMRQMQVGGNKALSFGRSRARLLTEDRKKVTFSDVAGIDEAKEEVVEIIEFLKDPHKFQKLGGRIPKGVLIVGPPGTGKTLLANAIDAVGRLRGAGLGGGHDEREQTLNQLLVEMDGFETSEGVILIAATNRPDVLDPALLRPGRFDRQITVNRPDVRGRAEILRVHTKKVPLAKDVDLEVISRGTPGFSGADLENLVNEAALLAARLNKTAVELKDFEFAKDKVLMGVERKSMVLTDEEKRTTAYHEAGHAMMARLLPGTDPVHKVTIIPRGRALGITMQLPVDDRHSYSKEFLYNNLAILMGGRVAEELVFKQITTGAGNDIARASELARKTVCEWGMSDELGPLTFGKKDEEIFLGREIATRRDYSEEIALKIDSEVKRLVTENYERAKRMLRENMAALKALAEALLEKEVLEAAAIDKIIQGAMSPIPQGIPA